jgi:hypothetical protein
MVHGRLLAVVRVAQNLCCFQFVQPDGDIIVDPGLGQPLLRVVVKGMLCSNNTGKTGVQLQLACSDLICDLNCSDQMLGFQADGQ